MQLKANKLQIQSIYDGYSREEASNWWDKLERKRFVCLYLFHYFTSQYVLNTMVQKNLTPIKTSIFCKNTHVVNTILDLTAWVFCTEEAYFIMQSTVKRLKLLCNERCFLMIHNRNINPFCTEASYTNNIGIVMTISIESLSIQEWQPIEKDKMVRFQLLTILRQMCCAFERFQSLKYGCCLVLIVWE